MIQQGKKLAICYAHMVIYEMLVVESISFYENIILKIQSRASFTEVPR